VRKSLAKATVIILRGSHFGNLATLLETVETVLRCCRKEGRNIDVTAISSCLVLLSVSKSIPIATDQISDLASFVAPWLGLIRLDLRIYQ